MPSTFDRTSAAALTDTELDDALTKIEQERLSVETLLSRTIETVRAHADAYRGQLACEIDPALFGWGIQIWRHWSDYPDWGDDDWYNAWTDALGTQHDMPLRFTNEAAALSWAALTGEQSFRRRHQQWLDRHEAAKPRLDLFAKRKALLVKHNLWLAPGETLAPLIYPGGAGHEPTREGHYGEHGDGRTRVVHDSEMDDPVLEWWLDNHALAKHD